MLLPLTPTKAELDKAKADKLKPEEYPKAAIAIVDLPSGKKWTASRATSFQVGGEGDEF